MATISGRMPAVKVEYLNKRTGDRTTKHFSDSYAARRFYVAKDKAGCQPRVLKA